jgi:hypothetical protein
MDSHTDQPVHGHAGGGARIGRWVFLGFALVAGYFLFTEHRAHLFGVLPYLLVLACPLMHLFHHHGHGGHAGHDQQQRHHSKSGDAAAPRDQ